MGVMGLYARLDALALARLLSSSQRSISSVVFTGKPGNRCKKIRHSNPTAGSMQNGAARVGTPTLGICGGSGFLDSGIS